jgi:Uncharacterised nucleotidyltransferase
MTTASFPSLTPHAELLLTCARVQLDEAHTQQLRSLLAYPQLDWDRLLALAARHSLLPLLARHLSALASDTIPTGVLERLRAYQQAIALRNLGLSGELVRVLRLFDEHRIPALPFKGPTLGEFAYGNPALREFGDLDLLLRPRDVPRARSHLADQGYRPQYSLTPAQEAAYLRSLRQIALEKPAGGVVELHAALSPRAFAFPLDLAALWPRRCIVKLTGQPVAAPGAEDLLLILCMHGAKHLWKSLGWICDVAELLRVQPALNWEQVRREARRLGSERLLGLGVQLAERVLQAPLPPDVSREAQRDATARALADRVLEHLFDEAEWRPGGWESAAFHLRLRERRRDGVRYCLSLLLAPTLADWTALPLPSPLAFLYYGVRPVRLLRKYVRPRRLSGNPPCR